MHARIAEAQTAEASASPDDSFQARAETYERVLRQRPRGGAAFDQWYRHYLDAGRLDQLENRLKEQTLSKPQDYTAALLCGLVLERRGQDDAAAEAYARARKLRPREYYPLYLSGTLLARRSRFQEATTAFEDAIRRDPPRLERLGICKRLGRLYQRQNRPDQALETWANVAREFPNDRRVLTEVAEVLAEERRFDDAIGYWEKVAELCGDDLHSQLQARLQIAQLHASDGRHQVALDEFDRALDALRPDSWMARYIERRIETLFAARDDLAGLEDYYRTRLRRAPDDLEAMVRLGRTLDRQGKPSEAASQLRLAIRVAPNRRDLREALIEGLVRAGKHSEAVREAESLVDKDPTDPDALRLLGQLHLEAGRATDGDGAQRLACEAWKRIADIRSDDAALAVTVAELCRQAERKRGHASHADLNAAPTDSPQATPPGASVLLQTAEQYYREAVARSPDDPKYREYLGDLLHVVGRDEQALAVWADIAAPPNGTADNWHRLARIYARHDYLEKAEDAGAASIAKEPNNVAYRNLQVELLLRSESYERALEQTAELERIADSPEATAAALRRRIEVAAEGGLVEAQVDQLREILQAAGGTADDHWAMGLLLASRRRYDEAARYLESASRIAPANRCLQESLAGIHEQGGDLAGAVARYRHMAEAFPRHNIVYYRHVVRLELALGRTEAANRSVDRLLALSPSYIEAHRLKAQTAFQLGQTTEGINALRKAVLIAPRDVDLRVELALVLADHQQYGEAWDQYWRCFDMSPNLGDQLTIASGLAQVGRAAGRIEPLIQELRQRRSRAASPRDLSLCLVEVYRSLGDLERVRAELDELLAKDPEDLDVLQQLVATARSEDSWDVAAKYQERIVSRDPTRQNLETLALFHSRSGDEAATEHVWERLLDQFDDAATILVAVDRHMTAASFERAAKLAAIGLERYRGDWRILLRLGVIDMIRGKDAEARRSLQQVVAGRDASFGASAHGAVASTSSGSQPRLASLPSPIRQQLPEWDEVLTAQESYSRIQRLRQTVKALASRPANDRRAMLRRVGVMQLVPSNRRSASVVGVLALYVLSLEDQPFGDWIEDKAALAGTDAEHWRHLALVWAATGPLSAVPQALDRLAEALPNDPLPHLVRFLVSIDRQKQPVPSGEQRDRQLDGLRESYRWLVENRPNLNQELVCAYAERLIDSYGRTGEAASLMSKAIADAQRLDQLPRFSQLSCRIGDVALQRKLLARAVGLSESRSVSTAHERHLLEILKGNNVYANDVPYLKSVLAVFQRYLEQRQLVAFTSAQVAAAGSPLASPPAGMRSRLRRPPRKPGEYPTFPTKSIYFSADCADALKHISLRFAAAGQTLLLAELLDRGTGHTEGSARVAYRLAKCYLAWWDNQRQAAVVQLEGICRDHPQDSWLRFHLAHAVAVNGDQNRALRELQKIRSTVPSIAGPDLQRLQLALCARISSTSRDDRLTLLSFLLERSDAEPYLDPIFHQAAHTPAQSVSPPGYVFTPGGSIPVVHSTANRKAPLGRLLEYARAQGKLDVIDQAAAGCWEKFPRNVQLGALISLMKLAQDDRDGMHRTAERCVTILKERPELAADDSVWLLAQECLNHDSPRSTGFRLGEHYLRAFRLKGQETAPQQALNQLGEVYLRHGQDEEGEDMLRELLRAYQRTPP